MEQTIGSMGGVAIERTNALTLINDSVEYLQAGLDLNKLYKKNTFSHPVYFLVLRSIELGLKALIRIHEGLSISLIKKRYDHNLLKLLNHCLDSKYLKITKSEFSAIDIINQFYYQKAFEYTITGYKTIPKIIYYINISQKIHSHFKQFSQQISKCKYI